MTHAREHSPLRLPFLMDMINLPGGAVHPFPPLAFIRRPPIILTGPLGLGKVMIARRVPWFLESLADIERTWIRAEAEAVGLPLPERVARPFRAPHHTVSTAGLIGAHHKAHRPTCPALGEHGAGGPCSGGAVIDTCRERVFRGGELHLARFGVLLLDEVTEFSTAALEALMGVWRWMSAGAPWIIGTAQLCPCGRFPEVACSCTVGMRNSHELRLHKAATILGINGFEERMIQVPRMTREELAALGEVQS